MNRTEWAAFDAFLIAGGTGALAVLSHASTLWTAGLLPFMAIAACAWILAASRYRRDAELARRHS